MQSSNVVHKATDVRVCILSVGVVPKCFLAYVCKFDLSGSVKHKKMYTKKKKCSTVGNNCGRTYFQHIDQTLTASSTTAMPLAATPSASAMVLGCKAYNF